MSQEVKPEPPPVTAITEEDTGAALRSLIADGNRDWEENAVACSGTCGGQRYYRVLYIDGAPFCRNCYDSIYTTRHAQIEAETLLPQRVELTGEWMERAGLSKRELGATLRFETEATKRLAAAFGAEWSDLDSGVIPSKGAGLSGIAGVGKTFALAAALKRCAYVWLGGEIRKTGARAMYAEWLTWLRWPEQVATIRVTSLRDGGHEEIASWVERWGAARLLVLDDLGAERSRGSYEEDFASSILDQIIDARCGAMLPTWFTTNLTFAALRGRIGARMFSRLTQDAVLVELPEGADLRVAKRNPKG